MMKQSWFRLAALLLLAGSLASTRANDHLVIKGNLSNGSSLNVTCQDKDGAITGLGKLTPAKGKEQVLIISAGSYSYQGGTILLQGKIEGSSTSFQIQAFAQSGQFTYTANPTAGKSTVCQGKGQATISDLSDAELDQALAAVLKAAGFTGRIQGQLETRLGRKLNPSLANTGRYLFFDNVLGLNRDNSCAGCHSPLYGFGDTQPISIGIQNNGIAGPGRKGPRNMRRAPMVINSAFYPNMMWNARFIALSGNPFDNKQGFAFPAPEGSTLSYLPTLLTAQAFIPVTEAVEMAGAFPGTHDQLRAEVVRRVNNVSGYRQLFGGQFPAVKQGGAITYDMIGLALAEFQTAHVYANAPVDRFARGESKAMSRGQKQGALLFFGKAGCIMCHKVAGPSNEMFSDFQPHAIGVPQLVPRITNVEFDGPNKNEDFGFEAVSRNASDRYKFRTAPLRNVALQPYFFHDGAFHRLEDAIAHHLNARASALKYSPVGQVAGDLAGPIAPIQPILAQLDPLLGQPIPLTSTEFARLVEFVRYGLLDPAATPAQLHKVIPKAVPSGMPVQVFQ